VSRCQCTLTKVLLLAHWLLSLGSPKVPARHLSAYLPYQPYLLLNSVSLLLPLLFFTHTYTTSTNSPLPFARLFLLLHHCSGLSLSRCDATGLTCVSICSALRVSSNIKPKPPSSFNRQHLSVATRCCYIHPCNWTRSHSDLDFLEAIDIKF
jgi:hypothetical protein